MKTLKDVIIISSFKRSSYEVTACIMYYELWMITDQTA